MKKAAKWMSGFGALLMGAAVMGAPLSVAWAAEGSGAQDGLGGDGEYKYDVRRGMYQEEGGAKHHVRPGRYVEHHEDVEWKE